MIPAGPGTPLSSPAAVGPTYEHLHRMSDDTGLFEHARRAVPRREHGYCVDDVARGLLVVCREPEPDAALIALAETYLAFVCHAQAPDGSFHNRLSFGRVWTDEPGLGDWWGHALWGLGTAASRGPTASIRDVGLEYFEAGARLRSPFVRSMVFAALGAAEVLAVRPDHASARKLLADAAKLIGSPGPDPVWPWPEERLRYGNASLVEVLIDAGHALGDDQLLENGLALLGWLLEYETPDGHLSLAPVGGRGAEDGRPAFDQQPIEAAAMADACARAYDLTGDQRWAEGVDMAVGWFLGKNDIGVPLRDDRSGGGCDGLLLDGVNPNQGAESTLALISTFQHAWRLAHGG